MHLMSDMLSCKTSKDKRDVLPSRQGDDSLLKCLFRTFYNLKKDIMYERGNFDFKDTDSPVKYRN